MLISLSVLALEPAVAAGSPFLSFLEGHPIAVDAVVLLTAIGFMAVIYVAVEGTLRLWARVRRGARRERYARPGIGLVNPVNEQFSKR